MAMDWRQLRAMLWKNWLFKLRHPWATLLEVLLPATIMLMLMVLRTQVDFRSHPDAAYIKNGMFVKVGASEMSPSFDDLLRLCVATGEHVAFVPDNDETTSMINILSFKFPLLQLVAKRYKDENTLQTYIKSTSYAKNESFPKIKAAVVFLEQGPCTYDYTIRLNHTWAFQGFPDVTQIMDTTGSYVNDLELGVNLIPTYEYGYSGFLTLQHVIDNFLMLIAQQQPELCRNNSHRDKGTWNSSFFTGNQNILPKIINIAPFPTREYTDDEFQTIVKSLLGLLYLLAFLYPISRLVSCSVLEKEKGIKEGMHMMGLRDASFYLSWFIIYMLQFAVSCLIITLITMNSIFAYSSVSVVFVYFFVFGLSAVALSFLISVFFTRAKTATAVGTLAFLAAFFPYYLVVNNDISTVVKLFASLLSPTAFALGTVNFADYERAHVGVRWSNLWKESSGVNFLLCLIMMMLDTVLYSLLAWYFGRVRASCGSTTLWGCLCKLFQGKTPEDDEMNEDVKSFIPESDIEPLTMDLEKQERCVQIRSLRKVYVNAGREIVAVNSLDLTLSEGQILALLGHNGAGKSTTIGMLVGLIPPTSGDAIVLGKSIKTDMDEIRKNMGVCPQYDLLFPELTVKEHMQLFGTLKRVSSSELPSQVDSMIAEVGLVDKTNTLVCHLSGGMKRKLSVALALLGGSKVVVLDEPTSGMDPYSMRLTWRLLKRNKKDRIILLTTHSMDEADVLGDRIAIMANGHLRCVGSSLFLKHRYGVGYTLTLVKGQEGAGSISEAVYRYVPSATILSDVGSELSFRLPLASTSAFQELFEELETHTTSSPTSTSTTDSSDDNITREESPWRIESYGISVTTLEEVFLRVASGEQQQEQQQKSWIYKGVPEDDASPSDDCIDVQSLVEEEARFEAPKSRYDLISSFVGVITRILMNVISVCLRYPILHLGKRRFLFGRHFRALFRKRALCALRDKKTVVFQLLVPSFFLLLGLLLLISRPHPDQPSVTFTTSLFNPLVTGLGGGGPIPFNLTLPIAKQVAKFVTGGWIQKEEFRAYRFPDPETVLKDSIQAAGPSLGPALVSMSEYLMTSFNETYESRYGAVVMEEQQDDGTIPYTVMHNTTCQHGAPTYINVMNNAILRFATNNTNLTIRTRNHPLPMTQTQHAQRRDLNAFSAGIIVNIAYSFIPASFAVAIVKEREVKAKHQQLISGVSLMAYWISTYVWDVISYLIPSGLALLLFFIFGMDEFIGRESIVATSILMFAYGPAIAASTYCLTFFFTDHSLAQNAILLIHFFSGLILMVASFIMGIVRATKKLNGVLKNIFRLSPGFCLADGLASLALRKQNLKPNSHVEPFAWNTTGASITYLCAEGVVYFLITLALELLPTPQVFITWCKSSVWGWKRKRFTKVSSFTEPFLADCVSLEDEDEDVARERRRLHSGASKDSMVRLMDLRKTFPGEPPKVAVDSLSFAVDAGECFGFLGTNGAGKTTTLSMICGELAPTEGSAYIVGHDVCSKPTDARHLIGYCPQFDALIDLLTVREHLELYANIKAVPEDNVDQVVDDKLTEFDLWAHAKKTAASLSGGNRRKLSVAIAMVADPPIVILDEPSTGMDPVARRFMWDVITRISTRRGLSAVILTTHSMAEAQALCTRIGIMAGGRLRCLGSPQHLKSRYGNSLELEVKAVAATQTEVDNTCTFLLQNLPSSSSGDSEIVSLNDFDQLLSQDDIMAAAFLLGNEQWGQALLSSMHASAGDGVLGELLVRELSQKGCVPARLFCEWWLAKDRASKIDLFIRASFPGASLLERNGSNFRYQLPHKSSSLARVFGHMEQHRSSAGIAEYNVGQATLEAVFNAIAAHH